MAPHSDVLIVGAGSAGSVLAERLSADPDRTVTVLEAGVGPDDPALRAAQADATRLPIGPGSALVRRYGTELTPGQRRDIVRGAAAGGSGAINGGYFCRALPADFDALKLPGWGYTALLDHFRAIETDLDFDGPAHGDHGPIPVARSRDFAAASAEFIGAAAGAGVAWVADLNAGAATSGVGPVPLNIAAGRRVGPGGALLAPALSRSNLRLRTQTRALSLRFAGGRATGVDAIGPDGPVTVTADRIVLCAGAIETAHLLMCSGVGEEEMLRAAGVPVHTVLPVGRYCADHPEWLLSTSWPATPGRPVLETVLHTDDGLELRPYTRGFAAMIGEPAPGHDPVRIGVALMRPRSRGRVSLAAADPMVAPRIEHRYDSEPADLAALRGGVRLAREIFGAAVALGEPDWSTSQHLCGSTPIGLDDDPRAVLDRKCRVRGIDGLWVVDGSVLPTVPSRGPHATIVAIAHRAAEFVAG